METIYNIIIRINYNRIFYISIFNSKDFIFILFIFNIIKNINWTNIIFLTIIL